MSRSTKKTPAGGFTSAQSEKYDKKKWHKRLRQRTKQSLTSTRYDVDTMEDTLLPEVHDVSDTWVMRKDGKGYWGKFKFWQLEEWFKKLLRK